MGSDEDIYKKGLIVKKQEELKKWQDEEDTHFKALHFYRIKYQFKIGEIDLEKLKNMTDSHYEAVENYQRVDEEIKKI